jgi:hypothetical protein
MDHTKMVVIATSSSSTSATGTSTIAPHHHAKKNHHYANTISWNLLIGGFAGAIAKTIVAPLERLRILKQTGGASGTMVGTAREITASEGVLGLWRGNIVNVMRIIPAKGVLFASNDFYKSLMKDRFPTTDDPENAPFWMLFSSGGLAGITAIIATYPLDVARTRLSGKIVTNEKAWTVQTTSVTMCLKRMAQEEGLRSWYRGIGPTLLGALPYEGIKFSVYGELTKNYFDKGNVWEKLMAGAIAGCAAGAFMFPNDTVRKLLQMQTPIDGGPPFKSALDCWKRTYKNEGITRFYRGVFPYMLRIAPGSAIQFAVYETLKRFVVKDD